MAKNRFEYNMEGIKEGGRGKRNVKQQAQGQAVGKKPTGDTGPRFNADPRMPAKTEYAGAQLVGKDRPPTYRSMAPGNMARAAKKARGRK